MDIKTVGICPDCGQVFVSEGMIMTHHWPIFTGRVCPGSGKTHRPLPVIGADPKPYSRPVITKDVRGHALIPLSEYHLGNLLALLKSAAGTPKEDGDWLGEMVETIANAMGDLNIPALQSNSGKIFTKGNLFKEVRGPKGP